MFTEWVQLFAESAVEVGCSDQEVERYIHFLNDEMKCCFIVSNDSKKTSIMKRVASVIHTIKDDGEYTAIVGLLSEIYVRLELLPTNI